MREPHAQVLGISAYYHDSAAALIVDGQIAAAAHEERFSRKKHDDRFPHQAVRYALDTHGLRPSQLDAVVFYDKPMLKFERLLETYHRTAPRGAASFVSAMPVWMKEKLFLRSVIRKELEKIEGGPVTVPLLFSEHHLSHAASAFYPSPFHEAAILTVDGVGEWATTTIGHGRGVEVGIIRETQFPNSLGLLYSAFTYYCGFKVNSGEYKLMGLAPYGIRRSKRVESYKRNILDELVSLKEDGSAALNMDYFAFDTGLHMCADSRWEELFHLPPRAPESDLTQEYMDLALAIQEVTEDAMLRLARSAQQATGSRALVMAGGVALNCVANEKIREAGIFDEVWVQPAAGDAGGALGAALAGYHLWLGKPRTLAAAGDAMQGSYLGPEYSALDVAAMAREHGAPYMRYESFDALCDAVAGRIADGAAVGWMQGRMEWGPRALGNRSILADPRNPEMQKKLNLKIKYREGFRPFAPAVLEQDAAEYFDLAQPSPYMLFTAPVVERRRKPAAASGEPLAARLYTPRSDIPAVTHLDYSARVQTVSPSDNPRFAQLLEAFKKRAGCSVLINTSFNVRGEPIVMTPDDAYRCFMNTEMDYLVIGDCFFSKEEQPAWTRTDPKEAYGLD